MRYRILRNFEIDLILDESLKFANTNYLRKVTLESCSYCKIADLYALFNCGPF